MITDFTFVGYEPGRQEPLLLLTEQNFNSTSVSDASGDAAHIDSKRKSAAHGKDTILESTIVEPSHFDTSVSPGTPKRDKGKRKATPALDHLFDGAETPRPGASQDSASTCSALTRSESIATSYTTHTYTTSFTGPSTLDSRRHSGLPMAWSRGRPLMAGGVELGSNAKQWWNARTLQEVESWAAMEAKLDSAWEERLQKQTDTNTQRNRSPSPKGVLSTPQLERPYRNQSKPTEVDQAALKKSTGNIDGAGQRQKSGVARKMTGLLKKISIGKKEKPSRGVGKSETMAEQTSRKP